MRPLAAPLAPAQGLPPAPSPVLGRPVAPQVCRLGWQLIWKVHLDASATCMCAGQRSNQPATGESTTSSSHTRQRPLAQASQRSIAVQAPSWQRTSSGAQHLSSCTQAAAHRSASCAAELGLRASSRACSAGQARLQPACAGSSCKGRRGLVLRLTQSAGCSRGAGIRQRHSTSCCCCCCAEAASRPQPRSRA